MSQWSRPKVSLPNETRAINSSVSRLGRRVSAALNAAEATLAAMGTFSRFQAKPLALAARVTATEARRAVSDFFSGGGYKLVLHPYVYGVGQGEGLTRHLSFPSMIERALEKLADKNDPAFPNFSNTPIESLFIAAGAPSPSLFLETVKALEPLLAMKEIRNLVRRIDQAFQLEKTKYVRKNSVRTPPWEAWNPREIPLMSNLESSLLSRIAILDGYARAADSSLTRIRKLITRKKRQIQAINDKQQAASRLSQSGLAKAGIHALHAAGKSALELKERIKNSTGAPGYELSFCVGILLVGHQGSLRALKNILKI